MVPGQGRHRLVTAVLCVIGAVAGLVIAGIVVLNVHIFAGLEQGYAATPAEVVEFSGLLAAADVLLLVGLPVLAVVAVLRMRRRSARTGPASPS